MSTRFTGPSRSSRPLVRRAALFAAILCAGGHAQAQTITPTSRTGNNYVACGAVVGGPLISHHFSTAVATHDPLSVSDNGGGYLPASSASDSFDVILTASSLSLSIVGASMRGVIPTGGSGSASASVQASDQWNFTIPQTTCFTLDATTTVYVSTGALTAGQGYQLGIDGFGGFTLADGSHPGILAANISATGSVTQHYNGTIAAGTYFMTVSGQADGNGAPRSASFNTSIALTLGPPVIGPAPTFTTGCAAGSTAFAVASVAGATYQWQIQTAPNTWQTLGNDPGPIACPGGGNGFAFATPLNSPSVNMGVHACPGVQHLPVRCVVTSTCGATPSAPATLTICPADFDCNGTLAVQDIFAFLNGWFAGVAAADFDGVNGLQVQDIFAFLNAWFGGC
jgi:hypothetical protein